MCLTFYLKGVTVTAQELGRSMNLVGFCFLCLWLLVLQRGGFALHCFSLWYNQCVYTQQEDSLLDLS